MIFRTAAALAIAALTTAPAFAEEVITSTFEAGPADDDPALGANGLYPLWEQTGVLHAAGTGQVSYGHAQLGLGRVQLGTQPFMDLSGNFNLQGKLALWQRGRSRAAFTAGYYRLAAGAHSRSLGDLHRPGLINPHAPLTLVPLSLAHSFTASRRVLVHAAATAMLQHGADRGLATSLGAAVLIDWRASRAWTTRLHAGYRGLRMDDTGHVGLSFRYTGPSVLLAAGMVRSSTLTGESHNDFLFDAGLLFR